MLGFALILIFLFWIFFVALTTSSLHYLGELRALKVIEKHPNHLYYFPLHKFLFKRKSYILLLALSKTSENLGRLGFGIALAFVTLLYFPQTWPLSYLVILFLMFVFLFLLFGNFLPRFIAMKAKEKAFLFSAPLSSPFLFLILPISFFFLKWESRFTEKGRRTRGMAYIEEDLKETILHILHTTDLKEPLNAFDKKLLESVIKFKERIVREVMVPRVDLFCLPANISIREAAHLLAQEGYSRTPLYKETIDNIVGVLLYKDVLELYMECEKKNKEWGSLNAHIETLAKRVFYTPETKKISHLLQEFRSKQMHMAIVIDEYGGTEGIVTIEDLLEEIVGEIGDEYDVGEEALYVLQPSGEWIVDASMSINDAEDTFQIHIPQEGDYDTLGGYVYDVVKTIPPKGYIIHHENFDLEIISITERSIEKVKIIPLPENQ